MPRMKQETLDMAERVLAARGFINKPKHVNLIEATLKIGEDLDVIVWGRDWSGLIVCVNHPSDYESGINLIQTKDEAELISVLDAIIPALTKTEQVRAAQQPPDEAAEQAEADKESLQEMDQYGAPKEFQVPLREYWIHGVEPSEPLRSLIVNYRNEDKDRDGLTMYMYRHVANGCLGSEAKMREWIRKAKDEKAHTVK